MARHPLSDSASSEIVPPESRLPRNRRLTGHHFKEVFAANRRYAGRYLVIWIRTKPEGSGAVGFVATKRIFARSVDRNRARRMMREAWRCHKYQIDPGCDLIMLARGTLLRATLSEVVDSLRQTCRKAGIWRELE